MHRRTRRAATRLAIGAMAPLAAAALALGAAAARPDAAPAAATVLEDQGFEGAFPPANWQVLDYAAPPGQYLWGRTTCTVPSGGGTASVWSVGAGTLGGGLACDGTYDAHAESDLVFGPIDATDFDGGLDVTAHVRLDLHRATDFQICITDPGAPGGVACFGAGVTQLAWNYFDPPIAFPQAAGVAEVYVLLRFRDRDPDAGMPKQGAWVDRVVIRGLSDAPPPSATPAATTPPASATAAATTPAPSATASPTATASATGSPTATNVATTAPATATPTASRTPTTAATLAATPSATATAAPSATATGGPTATTPAAPSATAVGTATATRTPAPSPSATATFDLPPPPTVPGEVTATPTPTSDPSRTPTASGTAPADATATPTVLVGPDEPRIYLPYAVRRRQP